jgi:hypothetical protein
LLRLTGPNRKRQPINSPLLIGRKSISERALNHPRCRRCLRILDLIHILEGPERYGALSFFETMPFRPRIIALARHPSI